MSYKIVQSYDKTKGPNQAMGMAASQARLLSITARLTDNENSGQSLSFTKISLANQTEQLNADYNEALNKTKLTVLTGFNGSEEVYEDINYGLMTNYGKIAGGLQYCVTDTKGRILVTTEQAEAFINSNGDYNKFMQALGYTIADITVTEDDETAAANDDDVAAKVDAAQSKIHEAWDKYLTSVGIHYGDEEHSVDYDWVDSTGCPIAVVDDGAGGTEQIPLTYEGTTQEQRELYDYAVALTEAYYGNLTLNTTNSAGGAGLKTAAFSENVPEMDFLKNIFYKMSSSDFFTYTTDATKAQDDPTHYILASQTNAMNNEATDLTTSPIDDNNTFEQFLRNGTLLLERFSSKDGEFVTTTLSDDSCIQEVEDERAIAQVEAQYEQDMTRLENEDNKIDLQLKKLDTEHTALQTEYDSVKNVIDKNIEKTFNMFS